MPTPSHASRLAATQLQASPFGRELREWNPILVREARARWRGARAYWLALAYAGFLSAILWWSYSHSGHEVATSPVDARDAAEAFTAAAAQRGHRLFSVLCYAQVGAGLLLPPILTASSFTGERRKGLLDGLLMSKLSTSQIVRGKLLSALSLVALLQLAGAPVVAVCFLMGGVSPLESVGAFAIQAATACCGAACGLLNSAASRNNSDAAAGSIGAVLAWMVGTGLAFSASCMPYAPLFHECVVFIASANPLLALGQMLSPPRAGTAGPVSWGAWSPFFSLGVGWIVSVAGMGLLTRWLLREASRALLRSPENIAAPHVERGSASTFDAYDSLQRPVFSSAGAERLGREPLRHEEETHSAPRGRQQMPILSRIVFGNAMMRREMSLLWRWHALSDNEVGGLCLLGMMALCTALVGLGVIFNSAEGARAVWWIVLGLCTAAGALLCASRPASSIAHERDGGAWQGLGLTMLTPLQIVGAKVAGPIVACLGYGSVAWVFLALAAWRGQIELSATVPGVLLMLLVWAQAASWSTIWGARARVPASALG